MALPVEFNTGVVEGTYVDLSGAPMVGLVQFTASPQVLIAATSEVIVVPIVREILLDPDGHFSITLPGTDDPDINPVNWTYEVREVFTGFTRSYSLHVPVGQTVDVSTESPVPSANGTVITRGPAGPSGPGYGGGFIVGPVNVNSPLDLTITSNWGLRNDGSVYYDDHGALPAEAALLVPDPLSGGLGVFRPGQPYAGPQATGLTNAQLGARVTTLENALPGKAPTVHTHTASQLSDASTVGRTLITAADAAAARAAIGAGTSSLALGTTASTAAAGNDTRLSDARTPTTHTHTSAQISDATDAATANTVVRRDINGNAILNRLSLGFAPNLADQATRKDYVDALIASVRTPVVIANAAARPASPVLGVRYKETDTGDVVAHDGTRWVKVGGAPRLLIDQPNGTASGFIAANSAYTPLLTYNTTAHTSGLLRAKWSGVMYGATNGAALVCLNYAGTQMPGSVSRVHNHGNAISVTFLCQSSVVSDGSAQSLTIYAAADAGGAQMQMLENSCSLWLEALPS